MAVNGSAGKLWGGRFTGTPSATTLLKLTRDRADISLGGLDPLMTEYNQSIYYDRAFYKQDIAGSLAWARANHNIGILSAEEFAKIEEGLGAVQKEWDAGRFDIKPGIDEDIHTANERRLSELIGKEVGGKLHTGRYVAHRQLG